MTLAGTWYNQLGSKMEITILQGQISGFYETAVGSGTGRYVLSGRTDTDGDQSRNAGWVVSWENQEGSLDSVTSWSGQLQVVSGKEVINSTWLLTIETDPGANWKSTLVGKDVFTREKPTDQAITEALELGTYSHPLRSS